MNGVAARFEGLTRRAPTVVVGTLIGDETEVVVLGDPHASRDSIFEIGSITKTFTALLLARMCEEGEVELSDPLSKFIPRAPSASEARDITLLDLATHTARLPGLPRSLLLEALLNRSNPYARYDYDRLEEALAHLRLKSRPGERFRYSNFGFAALGHALEKVTGVRYGELLVSRVCEPLGLEDTSPAPPGAKTARCLSGHRKVGRPAARWDLASFAPAGVLKSTVDDMLVYLRAHLDPDRTPLAEPLRRVQSPHFQVKKERVAIGLAWMIVTRKDRTFVWHNGATGGFSSFAGFSPNGGIALVALANARVAGRLTRIGVRGLEELLD
jgi:D-alanyl-D-alanine-carboxypeptidase/D-alanyl-D-alanine-endopeptidase